MELKDVITELISQPIKNQQRQDDLIDAVFALKTKAKYKKEIAAFFRLIGNRIRELSADSIESLMRLMYYMEIDADPLAPDASVTREIEEAGHTVEDRDTVWNNELALVLIKRLREAYGILGPEKKELSPAELQQQDRAFTTYINSEKLELEKSQYSTNTRDADMKKKLVKKKKDD